VKDLRVGIHLDGRYQEPGQKLSWSFPLVLVLYGSFRPMFLEVWRDCRDEE
jgi:hypothetical protein